LANLKRLFATTQTNMNDCYANRS